MEVTLVNRSVYSLPSKQRVGCIVYDGAADMQLWPGPGADRDLEEAYGEGLQRALDTELKQVDGRLLDVPSVIRVTPGRLHCDFLLWAATRAPQPGTEPSSAPGLALLRETVLASLTFAASRHVERIAFPALGAGPGEASREDRLVTIVKAAHEYHEQCIKDGIAPGVEEVLVCEGAGPAFRTAKNRVSGLAKASEREVVSVPKATAKTKASRPKKASSLKLTADDLASARGAAESYSMKRTYAVGDFFVHPKFGVGKVIEVAVPSSMVVAFEDGEQRKMVHGRG